MFFFCLVIAMSLCASVYICFVVTCWEGLTSWLSFVVSNCEFVTFPLVSWVRMYRFLIFAPLLTFFCLNPIFLQKSPWGRFLGRFDQFGYVLTRGRFDLHPSEVGPRCTTPDRRANSLGISVNRLTLCPSIPQRKPFVILACFGKF